MSENNGVSKVDIRKSRQLLTLTIIFFWASEYCHAPYFTPYLQTLGFTATLIGILTGTYGFTQMLVRIPLGIATDVTNGYKKTILMGTIFTTVSSFWLIFATDFVSIMICRVLAGVAASSWLAFTILYAAYYKADESVMAVTNINAYNNMGKLLAFVLGMISASVWGYRIPLVCSFLTGVAAICCALRLKPIPMKHEGFQLKNVIKALTHPAVLTAAFFAIIVQMYMQGTVFSFTSSVAKELGASAFEIGLNTLLFTVVQIVGASVMGKVILKKLSSMQAVVMSFLIMAIAAMMIAKADSMWYLYAAQIFSGIANMAVLSVLMAMIPRFIPQENQSTAMGLYQALYGIGMTLGPVMTGSISGSSGFSAAYIVMGGISLAAAFLAFLVLGRVEKYSIARMKREQEGK